MNPYLREDIEDYIIKYWREIHKRILVDFQYVSYPLKEFMDGCHIDDENTALDFAEIVVGPTNIHVPIIRKHYGRFGTCISSDVLSLSDTKLQYVSDMKERYKYQGK